MTATRAVGGRCRPRFQSGLSWLTILRKRQEFRCAFAGFDPEAVARFGGRDVERLGSDTSLVLDAGLWANGDTWAQVDDVSVAG